MIGAFLLIGQSNMAGRGELGQLPPVVNADVLMFREGQWMQAVEPVHQDKDIAAESMATAFGDAVQRAAGGQVGLIPCAMGGSALSEWTPGSVLFEQAVDTTCAALAQGACLKGILWHQGEADAGKRADARTYAARLAFMMETLKGALSAPEVPVVLGELGRFRDAKSSGPHSALVNRQIRALARSHESYAYVSSLGFDHKGDGLHFDTASLREMGRRYAEAWLALA